MSFSPWIRKLDVLQFYPCLQELSLSGCTFLTDEHLNGLSGLALVKLDLTTCYRVKGPGLSYLSNSLEWLSLNKCFYLEGEWLQCLENMPLKWLDLTYCRGMTDANLTVLPACLESLALRGCRNVRGVGISGRNFKMLDIQKCPVHDLTQFGEIGVLKTHDPVVKLCLDWVKDNVGLVESEGVYQCLDEIRDKIISALSGIDLSNISCYTNLTKLVLSNKNVSESEFRQVLQLKQLTELSIQQHTMNNDFLIETWQMIAQLNLDVLDICRYSVDDEIAGLFQRMPLKKLALKSTLVTSNVRFPKTCQTIELVKNKWMDGNIVKCLPEGIKRFKLEDCPLNREQLEVLATYRKLRELSLRSCQLRTVEALLRLPLNVLDIYRNDKLRWMGPIAELPLYQFVLPNYGCQDAALSHIPLLCYY